MNEQREIEKIRDCRAAMITTDQDRARFEQDFGVGHAFTTHPACDPVNEVYYYDFQEKRNKQHDGV